MDKKGNKTYNIVITTENVNMKKDYYNAISFHFFPSRRAE